MDADLGTPARASRGLLCLIISGAAVLGPVGGPSTRTAAGMAPHEARPTGMDPTRAYVPLDEIGPEPEALPSAVLTDDTTPRAERQIENARELYQEDRYTEAVQTLERALRYSPNSLPAHLLMAEVCLTADNPARAQQHLQKALQIDTQRARVHALSSRAHAALQEWAQAIADCRRALGCADIETDPVLHRRTRYQLADALSRSGYCSAAIEAYARFLAAAGATAAVADPEARILLRQLELAACLDQARLHQALDQPLAAAKALAGAAERDPNNAEVLRRSAALYQQAGRADDAVAAALAAARLDIDTGLPLLVDLRRSSREPEALLGDLRTLASAQPHAAAVALALADEYQRLDQTEQAIQTLQDYLTHHPNSAAAAIRLSELLLKQQRWRASLDILAGLIADSPDPQDQTARWIQRLQESGSCAALLEALRLDLSDPTWSAAHLYLVGQVARAADRLDLAEAAYRRKLGESSATALALAELLIDESRWQEAIDILLQVSSKPPANFRTARLLGEAYLGLDHYQRAADALNDAIRLNRSDLPTLELLAKVYEEAGKPLQARRQYGIIVERDPHNAHALEALFLLALNDQDRDAARDLLKTLERVESLQATCRRSQALLTMIEQRDLNAYFATMESILDDHPEDVETLMQLARAHLNRQELDDARGYLERVIAIEPHNHTAQHIRCLIDLQQLHFAAAIDNLRSRLAIHPRRVQWQQTLVLALTGDQRFAEAATALAAFLADPELPDPPRGGFYYDLIMTLTLDHQQERAAELLQAWMAPEPERVEFKVLWIDLCRMMDRTERAVQDAERWLEAAGLQDRNLFRNLLLQAYWGAQNYQDAEVLVLDWLEENPESQETSLRMIRTLEQAGRREEAIELARAGPEILTDDLVSLYVEAKDYEAAIRIIRDRIGQTPQALPGMPERESALAELRHRLCFVLITAQRYAIAERELTAWLNESVHPAVQIQIRRLMSWCYQMSGRTSLSLQQLEEILEITPDDPGISNDLGYSWAAQGMELERAERMIRLAVGSDPRSAAYLDSLGWILYKKGRFDEARHWLKRAAETPMGRWSEWLGSDDHRCGRDDAVIQNHLGDVAWRLNDREAAVSAWTKSLELARAESADSPGTPELQEVLTAVPAKLNAAAGGGTPEVAAVASEPPRDDP